MPADAVNLKICDDNYANFALNIAFQTYVRSHPKKIVSVSCPYRRMYAKKN